MGPGGSSFGAGALYAEQRAEPQTSVVVLRSNQDVDALLPHLRAALREADATGR